MEYLEEVTTASRARITQLCVNRGVHLYEKPKNPHILDDLLNTLMAQDVIEIADSPPIVDFWNERGNYVLLFYLNFYQDLNDQVL